MATSSDPGGLWELEPVVNQWVLDYFFHLYVDAFKNCRNDDFEEVRDMVSILIERRLKSVAQNSRLLLMMRLLSCIKEGEDLDCKFEKDKNETPLESAVGVMEIMKQEKMFPDDLIDANKQMLKEAAVVFCIQQQQFSRAMTILRKQVSNSRKTKLQADLMNIIQKQNVKHPLIANFSISTVKEKVYDMFENHVQDVPSFLLNLARKKSTNRNGKFEEPFTVDEQPEQSTRRVFPQKESSTQNNSPPASESKHDTSSETDIGSEIDCGPTYSLSAIRSKFLLLCQDDNPDVKFKHLCETDFCRENIHLYNVSPKTQNSKSPRPCSPRTESSVLREMGQRKCKVSLHQLVMGQESQPEIEEEEKPKKASPKKPTQQKRSSESVKRWFNGPVLSKKQKTSKKRPVKASASVIEEQETWSDEDNLFLEGRAAKSVNSSITSSRRMKWTREETEWVKLGVEKYGEGNWTKIQKRYPFENRTSIMIKDRWRTMKKLGLV
ncbi:factor 2 [Pristimantis euphronides]